jgi:hypothetical protein
MRQDPFGDDANDIDVLSYHAKFCDSLDFHLRKAWLLCDHWVAPSGTWVSPKANWTNPLKERTAAKWRHAKHAACSSRPPELYSHPPGESSF